MKEEGEVELGKKMMHSLSIYKEASLEHLKWEEGTIQHQLEAEEDLE
jgi:hypothetical protein